MLMPTSLRARRRLLALCAGALVLYLAVLSGQRALDGYRARQQVTAAVQEIESLRGQNLVLQSELNNALQENEIERVARNELGLVRTGDHSIVLIWPDGAPPPSSLHPGNVSPRPPRFREWLRLFLD